MKHSFEFAFERVILKPLEKEDIEMLRVLRNQQKQFFITNQEITKEGQEKWYQSYLQKEDDIMFKIVKKDDPEKFIGAIALYDIDRKESIAEFGRIVVDKAKAPEKGIGTEATKAICLFGFEVLKLRKIICDVLKTNVRSIHVYKRVGFRIQRERKNLYDMEITREEVCLDERNL